MGDPLVGGRLRKFAFLVAGLLLALLAKPAVLAFFVLDTRIALPGGLPDGWHIRVTRGTPDVTVVRDLPGSVLRFKSRGSSFGVERAVDVDPAQYPFLTWKWKVSELPRGGDFRHARTDDQAAQILLAFEDRRILSYLWDSTAPRDTMQNASAIPLIHIFAVVCRSGAAESNQWLSEGRNLAEDYRRAFGDRAVPHLRGIRLQINTQHTGTSAESYFGDVAFRNAL
jgi:hypothetical protein